MTGGAIFGASEAAISCIIGAPWTHGIDFKLSEIREWLDNNILVGVDGKGK